MFLGLSCLSLGRFVCLHLNLTAVCAVTSCASCTTYISNSALHSGKMCAHCPFLSVKL